MTDNQPENQDGKPASEPVIPPTIRPVVAANASASEDEPSGRKQDSASRQQDQMPKPKSHWPDRVVALFSAVLALVAYLQYTVTNEQLTEMKLATEATRLDQRAWVIPFDVVSEPHEGIADAIIFKVLYKNTGKTPAIKVSAWIGQTDDISRIPENDIFNSESAVMLAPDGIGNTSTADFPIKADTVQAIKNGRRIYIYGTIWYHDIFGKHHWTQFCYYIGPSLKSFGSPTVHNSCDDVEPKKK